jgi:hypothetical protein
MAITEQDFRRAQETVINLQSEVFFRKLAAYGVVPNSEEDARFLLQEGGQILADMPRNTQQAVEIKQASYEVFQDPNRRPASDGFSADAHEVVDYIFQNQPELVKAAGVFVAASTGADK